MALPWWVPFGAVPEVDPASLHAELVGDAPPLLLDVRTALEFEAGHLGGGIHVPITRLAAALLGLQLDSGRGVVAICLSAHRSIPAVRLLRRRGVIARQLAGECSPGGPRACRRSRGAELEPVASSAARPGGLDAATHPRRLVPDERVASPFLGPSRA